MPRTDSITEWLVAWSQGQDEALERLTPILYGELQRRAHRALWDEKAPPLQTTELVHEAYLRLVGARVEWQCRGHFYVIAARQMRRILVDFARRRAAQKRSGEAQRVTLTDGKIAGEPPTDVLALHDALTELAAFDARKQQVVELSYFAGLTIPEIARSLDISTATVERDLRLARAWLAKTLRGAPTGTKPSSA